MSETFSYDELPYPSKFFVQTHPDRLATQATLFGMSPADVATCRVLELGCGNGSNLIAQAFLLPDASFVGVDLAKTHIDDAITASKELGLSNVEFRQMDVMEMSVADFGTFDFITAHGLFSWIPDVVRIKVLELYRDLLTENGVGYISYSAYPGAHQREMVQRTMRYHVRESAEPEEKVGKALSFLKFLSENTPDRGTYKSTLTDELKRHGSHTVSDVFHDDLSDCNQAFYFHEFAEMLAGSGLQFLAEAELHAMGTQNLPKDARAFIDSLDEIVEREQYLDLLRGRVFRQTLFCHKNIELDRNVEPAVIDRFFIKSTLRPHRPNPDLVSTKIEKFVGFTNASIELDQPLAKAALSILGNVWGRAVAFPDLIENSKRLLTEHGYSWDDWHRQTDIVRTILLQIAMASSMVELHVHQPTGYTEVSEMPAVNPLARWQLGSTNNILTTLGLDMKIEDHVSRRLLELLDGTRDKTDLIYAMTEFIKASKDIDKKLLRTLPEWIDESVASLGRIGVFSA
ncbi:MAG TPA: class I SAM-dependent methyltransferase [Pyrinomonadaceae bacterium]|nr:class I SAM-dependent methyltransferase [Pyrinomonadaceae bacterium]